MSIESDLFNTLAPLVPGPAGGKVYPDTFPENLPWPAIRYTFISSVPEQTVCGSGGDNETDMRIQLDGIAKTDKDRNALRTAIMNAMQAYPIANVCESWTKDYDVETKSFRIQLDYLLQPSSDAP